jgi:hypothetical protein
MHRALWLLLWLDLKSGVRALVRGRSSWRKLGMVLMVLLFVGMIAMGQWANVSLGSAGQNSEFLNMQRLRFGQAMPFWALVYLLAAWLTAAADRGLIMRPAEIHFLVAGPFAAHEILTLNLVRLAYRALVSSVVLTAVGFAYMPHVLSGFVGIWMVLTVSLLVGMIVSLAARKALPGFVLRLRRLISVAALAVLVFIVIQSVQALNAAGENIDFSKVAAQANQTPLGKIVLPPVAWLFAPLQQAVFWPVVPLQFLVRLPVLAGLVLLMYALGGAFGEAATERTDRAIERRQAALRSGAAEQSSWARRLRIPHFGRWGGVGSVAWLEMTQSLRLLPRFLLYTAAIVTLILVLPLVMQGQRLEGLGGLMWLAGLTTYADFLMLLQLPVGFLGPVSHRLMFKQLPLPAWRIVLGALAGPLLPVMATHVLTGVLFLFLLRDQQLYVIVVSFTLLPAAFVLAATINLLGLWNIIKPRALQQRDALAAGRAMLSVWLFGALTIPSAVMAGLGALLVGLVFDSLPGYLIGAAGGLIVSGVVLVWLLAIFFQRWYPEAGISDEEEKELNR